MTEEIYVSTDVETDGPIPGPNSMLSFGSAAFKASGETIGTFTRNLDTLTGATADPETEAWWTTQPDAWVECRSNPVPVTEAMRDYRTWLQDLPGKPVFVGYPAGFDFLFIYWYLMAFESFSPFGFSALDIKTYAMAVLKTGFRETSKKRMPARWFSERPHTHKALDDAIEQGELFINILRESRA